MDSFVVAPAARYSEGDAPYIFRNFLLKWLGSAMPQAAIICLIESDGFVSKFSALRKRACSTNCLGMHPVAARTRARKLDTDIPHAAASDETVAALL